MTADTRNDEALHGAIRAAHHAKRVELRIAYDTLNRHGSPVYDLWDNLLPLLLLMVASMAMLLALGMLVGMIAMLLGILIYLLGIQHWIAFRLYDRTLRVALLDTKRFQILWKHGGIALLLPDTGEVCKAPEGDWRKFVRRYLSPVAEDHGLGL